jgi:hypothetical protein
MTRRRFGIFIGLPMAVIGTASLAFAVAAYIQRLPDPETADRRGLFRWLVERDLRDEPRDLQLAIMRRVEKELLAGVDFREVAAMLNDSQRKLLLENADLLARAWFHREAELYLAAPEPTRPLVLGRQIEQIQRLGIMDQLSALENWSAEHGSGVGAQGSEKPAAPGAATHATTNSLATIATQIKRVERWLVEAEPPERPRLAQFFTALRDRLLLNSFRNFDSLRNWLPQSASNAAATESEKPGNSVEAAESPRR